MKRPRTPQERVELALLIVITIALIAYSIYQLVTVVQAYRDPVWAESVAITNTIPLPRIFLIPIIGPLSMKEPPSVRNIFCKCPASEPFCPACNSVLLPYRYVGCFEAAPVLSVCQGVNSTWIDINYAGGIVANQLNYITISFNSTIVGAATVMVVPEPALQNAGADDTLEAELFAAQVVVRSGDFTSIRLAATQKQYIQTYFPIYTRNTSMTFESAVLGTFLLKIDSAVNTTNPDVSYALTVEFGSSDVTVLQQTVTHDVLYLLAAIGGGISLANHGRRGVMWILKRTLFRNTDTSAVTKQTPLKTNLLDRDESY
eukprot:TRINITY_DN13730_c0_g1_i1.p1 TRINITY_DN13730_c0_g1~~TRINITY_DN13730_c0_g1_i1.p1  ORF type:complete len:316 (-),score=53.96 TRINITY_DN13730_c0_g1_i1:99-1046(-)